MIVWLVPRWQKDSYVIIHNKSKKSKSTLLVQGRLFCGTVSAADGKGLKQKMLIASKTMNALCTWSVTLGATPQVSIGLSYAWKLNPRDCRLFLASAAVAKFNEMVAPENDLLLTCTPLMSHLRQLTTSFKKEGSVKIQSDKDFITYKWVIDLFKERVLLLKWFTILFHRIIAQV